MVTRLLWPRMAWSSSRLNPLARRMVANVCLAVCGPPFFSIPAAVMGWSHQRCRSKRPVYEMPFVVKEQAVTIFQLLQYFFLVEYV